jgi:hypothetical protein
MSCLIPARSISSPGLAAVLVLGLAGHATAQSVAATTTVSSSWVILPSEEVIYRYYPKYQQDHGVAGVAEINCRVRNRRDLDQCLVKSETPERNGFGDAAVKMAQAEFHALPEPVTGTETNATVTIRVAFTPKLSADSEAAVAGAAPAAAAVGADDPAAVISWGQSVTSLDWHYAAPARGQISFWKAETRLSPTTVRGAVRYEYFAQAGAPATTVRSSVVTYEFDCAGHAYRPLGVTTYVQPNLAGAPTALSGPATAAQKLTPGSVLEDAASRVCQFDSTAAVGRGAEKIAATSAAPSKP